MQYHNVHYAHTPLVLYNLPFNIIAISYACTCILQGQHYAMLGNLSTSKKTCTPDNNDQEKTVYCVIQPGSLVPTTAALCIEPGTGSEKNAANTGNIKSIY